MPAASDRRFWVLGSARSVLRRAGRLQPCYTRSACWSSSGCWWRFASAAARPSANGRLIGRRSDGGPRLISVRRLSAEALLLGRTCRQVPQCSQPSDGAGKAREHAAAIRAPAEVAVGASCSLPVEPPLQVLRHARSGFAAVAPMPFQRIQSGCHLQSSSAPAWRSARREYGPGAPGVCAALFISTHLTAARVERIHLAGEGFALCAWRAKSRAESSHGVDGRVC